MLGDTSTFLIKIIFNLYIYVVILRALLQFVNVEYYNPVTQFVFRLTDFPLNLLRKIISKKIFGVEICIFVFILLLEIIKFILLFVAMGTFPNMLGLIFLSVISPIRQLIDLYFYLILFRVISSWVMHAYTTTMTFMLFKLTEPLLSQVKKIIPPMGGLDLSPIVVIILLQLMAAIFISPLMQIGMRISLG